MTRAAAAAVVAVSALLGGCGSGLPGAVGGADSYPVTAAFDDVSSLVTHETCRAGGVVVGSVSAITLGPDLRARVTCAIDESVNLPANAVAAVRETSLLGERFVALDPPPGAAPTGRLAPGTEVPTAGTATTPDTEQVLGALSAVLTGGDLGSVHTITTELNAAMTGREDRIRGALAGLNAFTGRLDAHRADLTRTLDGLDRLTGTVARQRDVLGRALESVPGGLAVLDDQRGDLLALVDRLHQLSDTARPVLTAGTDDLVANLRALDPVLRGLAAEGRGIAPALELLSLPVGNTSRAAVKNDYGGFCGTVPVDLDMLTRGLTPPRSAAPAPLGPLTPPGALPDPVRPAPLPAPLAGLGRLLTGGR